MNTLTIPYNNNKKIIKMNLKGCISSRRKDFDVFPEIEGN